MSDGDDQTSDLSVSFLCGDREMATCDHQSMLEIEYQWTVSEVCNSWEKVEGDGNGVNRSAFHFSRKSHFTFCSVEIYSAVKTRGRFHAKTSLLQTILSLTCWKILSSILNKKFWPCLLFFSVTVVFMLRCISKSSTRSRVRFVFLKKQRAKSNKLQDELAVQTSNVANLTVERDNLTFGIARMESERDKWKAIARERGAKLADMTEELQSTTKQLNSTVEQLKLDNRSLTDNHESLWKLQKENKLTDFSLMVDNKSIQVHKVVLAMKSKFFAQQFEEHPEKLEYSIEGTTFEAVEQMVEFVYLGDAENFDEHLNELYILSVRFHIDALKEKCVKSLESKLTIETSPEVFILATKYKDEKLSQIVIDYIQEQNGGKESLYSSNAFYHLLETDVELYKEVAKTLRRSTNQN
ncbi:hypothetical protein M3Y94_00506500 [Aphelenchoides besseyi]|nr:hypothetical protein M3Y94_00506500 [Aphelenchoides besseyi]